MKQLDAGHLYTVECYDGEVVIHIPFMKRIGERYPGNIPPAHCGTNCQELIRVLIDRMKYLNDQIPCNETKECINLARIMLYLFEARAKRVKKEILPLISKDIEGIPTCRVCGHIFCKEHQS